MIELSDSPVSEDDDDNNDTGSNIDQQQQPHTDRDSNDQCNSCINNTVYRTDISTYSTDW